MDEELRAQLREAYNLKAAERDARIVSDWHIERRNTFGALLLQEGKKTLLELGAGTGSDGRYFQELGVDVLCTDLSTENVLLCRAKGLNAIEMDIAQFDLPGVSYDAVYAMNSLLHLPKVELPTVLGNIQAVLEPGGLFYMGVYGGIDFEDVWEDDHYEPKRFFSFHTDDQLEGILSQFFSIMDFTITKNVGSGNDPHHQSVTMRRD